MKKKPLHSYPGVRRPHRALHAPPPALVKLFRAPPCRVARYNALVAPSHGGACAMKSTAFAPTLLVILGVWLSLAAAQEPAGKGAKKDYAELGRLIHKMIGGQFPKEFEQDVNWGKTIPIPDGLRLPRCGRARPGRQPRGVAARAVAQGAGQDRRPGQRCDDSCARPATEGPRSLSPDARRRCCPPRRNGGRSLAEGAAAAEPHRSGQRGTWHGSGVRREGPPRSEAAVR